MPAPTSAWWRVVLFHRETRARDRVFEDDELGTHAGVALGRRLNCDRSWRFFALLNRLGGQLFQALQYASGATLQSRVFESDNGRKCSLGSRTLGGNSPRKRA
jgi:hypothetical protein